MYVTVDTVSARVGETVTVTVSANADRVAAMSLKLAYDTNALDCTAAEIGGFVANMDEKAAVIKEDVGEIWLTALALDAVTNDSEVVLTLTFTILDAAADTNAITLKESTVCFDNYQDQTVDYTEGAVNVIRKGKGDVDLNGTVNMRDALLLYRYVSGAVELNAEQLAEGDVSAVIGDVNMRDALLLYRYVNGSINEF